MFNELKYFIRFISMCTIAAGVTIIVAPIVFEFFEFVITINPFSTAVTLLIIGCIGMIISIHK